MHHSQLLEWLIDTGRLDVSNARLDERITYHDACYLGRHNDIYLAPRNVIGHIASVEVAEMARNGTKGFCCGAGGARMWMEETAGKKVNDERSQEAIATGATRVATACPFCSIMIDDGVKAQGDEGDQVKVADISIHLLDALNETRQTRRRNAPGPGSLPTVVERPACESRSGMRPGTGRAPSDASLPHSSPAREPDSAGSPARSSWPPVSTIPTSSRAAGWSTSSQMLSWLS